MSLKQTILKGTVLLTFTGFATRFMGFFYRIFLSQTFGEEGVGLYQLIFPVYALCFSLTSAGIETALARCVAGCMSTGQKSKVKSFLYTSLLLSVTASCIVTLFLQNYANVIACQFLKDIRCTDFLIILSYAFPFASVHSCIIGYYFGLKEPKIPAFSQLIEQVVRIVSVYLLFLAGEKSGIQFGISIAVAGLVTGEIASSLFCLRSITRKLFLYQKNEKKSFHTSSYFRNMKELLFLSCPLTASKVLLNILQSIEAISIPVSLQKYGVSASQALSIYGVLTGMALPCILFPSAITNSVATMLLPSIAEAQALNHRRQMKNIVKKSVLSCIFLGSGFCVFLLLAGQQIGIVLFSSHLSGNFIITLAWMCPFLYTNTLLISILNGIGKTTLSFLFNTISLGIRIMSVFFAIPVFGIKGYLIGLLLSQICTFTLCLFYLSFYFSTGYRETSAQ